MYNKTLKPIIAGLFMGWANVIPGVSGGTIAVITGVFERLIDIVNDLIKIKITKKDLLFILMIGLGILFGILSGSKILSWAFENYPFYTYSFFYGLIMLSLWNFRKDVSQFKVMEFSIGVLLVIIPSILQGYKHNALNVEANYFLVLISGIAAGSSMILPGLSGSLVLMLLGYYEMAINTVSKLAQFSNGTFKISDMFFLISLGIGVLIGIGIMSKILKIWFEKGKKSILNFILGLLTGSLYPITPAFHGSGNLLGMFLWIAIGGIVVYFLGKFES
jgi:putative membrane protein